ncbi:MAG: PAS domain S-box protein [Bacteroidales bacterium]|nr:PAS domain S-box protein [Bacteroidales bacterium]
MKSNKKPSIGKLLEENKLLRDLLDSMKTDPDLKAKAEEYQSLFEEYLSQNEELREKNEKLQALNKLLHKENALRKQAEQEIAASEERYILATTATDNGIWDWVVSSNEVYYSDHWKRQVGYKPHELENKFSSWQNLLHPEDYDRMHQEVDKYLKNPKGLFVAEFRMRHKNGTYRWIRNSAASKKDKNGNVVRMFGTHQDITNQKKIETLLESSEKKYKALIDYAPEAIFVHDKNGNIIHANKIACQRLGYSLTELIKFDVTDIDPDIISRGDKKFFWPKVPIKFEARHKAKSGKIIPVEISLNSIEHQGVKTYIAHASDISERKLSEKLLKESESHFRKLYIESPNPFHSLNKEGKIIDINPAWEKYLGYSKTEVIGNHISEFLTINKTAFNKQLKDFIVNQEIQNKEYIFKSKSGKVLHSLVNGKISYSNEGKFERTHCVLNNITERVNNEKERIRLEQAIVQSNSPIVITDAARNIDFINPAYTDITGYSLEEAQGKNPRFLKSGLHSKEFYQYLWQKIISGETWKGEFCNKKKNGDVYWEMATISPVFDRQKKLISYIKVSEDITSKKQAEEGLRIAKEKAEEASHVKNAFLANMSHEIRTPMNGIVGFSELLARPNLSEEQRKKFVGIINNNCANLLKLIDDIIDISKIEAKQMKTHLQPVGIKEVFGEIKALAEQQISNLNKKDLLLEITLDKQINELEIQTDPLRLKQVLLNLITNAIKFTDKGEIIIGGKIKKDYIEFFVKDTGIGIEKENIELIFSEFTQANKTIQERFGGSGLGLSISKGLVRLLGGEIFVESEPGRGSTFSFTIPNIKPRGISIISETKTTGDYNWTNKKILVVEDIETNYLFLEYALKTTNAKIFHAENGKNALEMSNKNNFDIILMDINLPDINGVEVTRQILERKPGQIIIAQTAYAMQEEINLFTAAGCADYITKPIRTENLLNTLSKFLK